MTVLRTLPQLQKLDNVAVTQEELREASRKGKVLTHPEDPQESEEEEYIPQNQYQQRHQEYPPEQEYSPQRSPPRQEVCALFCVFNSVLITNNDLSTSGKYAVLVPYA